MTLKGALLTLAVIWYLSFGVVSNAYAAQPDTFYFSRDLTLGSLGTDVIALQKYLNDHDYLVASSGPGASGNETDYFGTLTKLALIKFQNTYAKAILAPLGLTKGTGNFFGNTRNFINDLAQPTASSTASTAPSSTPSIVTPEEPSSPKIISGEHYSGSSEATLVIPTITFGNSTKNYGDPAFTLSPTSNSSGSFSFSSNNPSVATVSGNTVTIVGAGTAVIIATQSASGNYGSADASSVLTVNGILSSIIFNAITAYIGDVVTLSPTSSSTGAFTFTSENTAIATISGDMCTPVGTGTTTVDALQAPAGNYATSTASSTLQVYANQCNPNPCQNGGACTPEPGTYSCSCPEYYSGQNCQLNDEICNGACQNGGTCVPNDSGGSCDCTGTCYMGSTCTQVNPDAPGCFGS